MNILAEFSFTVIGDEKISAKLPFDGIKYVDIRHDIIYEFLATRKWIELYNLDKRLLDATTKPKFLQFLQLVKVSMLSVDTSGKLSKDIALLKEYIKLVKISF